MTNEIRYFSMFSGVGGFELGLENAGSQPNLQRGWNENSRGTQDIQPEGYQPSNETTANNSQSLSEVEQDWEGWNRSVNEWGELLCTRQKSSFCCVGLSEWDKYSNQVLKYKFPEIKNWGDCTKINPTELPDFDMLCGGFPCQAFSIAGKRRGFEDIRGTMFFEVARILKVKRPKTILLENVKGLLNHAKGETFRVILQTLDELGYEVQWMVLNSKFFGVPQNRERVLIIGSLRGERRPEILPFGFTDEQTSIKYFQKSKAQHSRIYNTDGISPTLAGNAGGLGGETGLYETRAVLTPDRANKRQNGRRFKEPGEPSFTVTGQDIHGIATDSTIRRLTPVECEFLQGFPMNWTRWGVSFINLETYTKGNGNAEKTNTNKILSLLQETTDTWEGEKRRFTELITLLQKEILQPRMYEERLQGKMEEGECNRQNEQCSCPTINYCNELLDLWKDQKPRCSPQRQDKIQQLVDKLTSSLQKLSYEVTSQRGRVEQSQSFKQGERYFGKIHLMSDTQRYKQMGNAVTTNVIAAVGTQILNIKSKEQDNE